MITDWNIQSRARGCEACGKPFADKEAYHTLLFDEKGGFRRCDICATCWQQQYSEGARDRKGFVSYWQGVYEAPPPPTETVKKATAETLLRQLIDLNDPKYVPAGFILAAMLERKRLLKVKEQLVHEGKRVFIYEHPKTGEVFTISDPDLRLHQLEQVQREVAALLEHGLNPPPDPESASATGDSTPSQSDSLPSSDAQAQPDSAAPTNAD